MRTSDFDYPLPPERIAQQPAEPRDASRLLRLGRHDGSVAHYRFADLPQLLRPGDLLVLNVTRVIPARLRAVKEPGGGHAELLLLRRIESATWEAWVGGRHLGPGAGIRLRDGSRAEVLADLGGPRRTIRFDSPITPRLSKLGEAPLPPYIHEPLKQANRYQTVYARDPGSAAAPTAGLHFTPELLHALHDHGIERAEITLHIGLDTFAPVLEEDPERHAIHSEWCEISPAAAASIAAARNRGGRVICVGTTTVRSLESAAIEGEVVPFVGPTRLYILPGYSFRVADGLITNFHLPRSTLLMMVSAFAGRERVLQAYRAALDEGYRFYSFGDAMLIL